MTTTSEVSLKILITGAAGNVGQQLHSFLKRLGYEVHGVDAKVHKTCTSVDLTNELAVHQLINSYRPHIIIHLAALTNIQYCERNVEEARRVNYGTTEILSRVCRDADVRLIYFSTDYVFGQRDTYWSEDDVTCPTTIYGRDKADSEALIQNTLMNYAIIRTAQLYGLAGDFIHLIQDEIRDVGKFEAFANLVNCPTWISDLFNMLKLIIAEGHRGIFHCIGTEPVSRYDYAMAIAEALTIDPSLIRPLQLDFSRDVRPPVVRLDGSNTYKKLQYFPKTLKHNLLLCTSSESDSWKSQI